MGGNFIPIDIDPVSKNGTRSALIPSIYSTLFKPVQGDRDLLHGIGKRSVDRGISFILNLAKLGNKLSPAIGSSIFSSHRMTQLSSNGTGQQTLKVAPPQGMLSPIGRELWVWICALSLISNPVRIHLTVSQNKV